jgi:hypothetical protein
VHRPSPRCASGSAAPRIGIAVPAVSRSSAGDLIRAECAIHQGECALAVHCPAESGRPIFALQPIKVWRVGGRIRRVACLGAVGVESGGKDRSTLGRNSTTKGRTSGITVARGPQIRADAVCSAWTSLAATGGVKPEKTIRNLEHSGAVYGASGRGGSGPS